MTGFEWFNFLSNVVLVVALIAGFIFRNWIRARIEKGVTHRFDAKLEEIRSDFRKSEDRLKSDLAAKESEISTIRASVLNGSASRQAMLDQRRIQAVEKIWNTVVDLNPYKRAALTLTSFKIDALAKEVPSNAKVREMLGLFSRGASVEKFTTVDATTERPFVSALAWAYFSAYSAVIMSNFVLLKMLEHGVEDSQDLLNRKELEAVLLAALPEYGDFVKTSDASSLLLLLNEIETRLLAELRSMLEGRDVDLAGVQRAKEVMTAIENVRADQAASEIARAVGRSAGT